MAHFAKLGVNGKVIAVHGLDNDQMLNADGQEDESVGQQRLQQIHGWPSQMWIQTSYNTRGGVYYNEDGSVIPVTVIEAGPCVVVQKKNDDKDGYNAIQLGFEDQKEERLKKPERGHFKKAGVVSKKIVREFIDNSLLARDARALRRHFKEISPDTELKVDLAYSDG